MSLAKQQVPPYPLAKALAALVLTALLTIGFNFAGFFATERFSLIMRQVRRLEQLRGRIAQLDEVLTMSARLAAASGELQWEERYNSFDSELDAAIKEAIALSPNARSGEHVKNTDEANQKLVAMERAAFAAVRKGRKAEARELLFGAEYLRQKEIYARGMLEFSARLTERITDFEKELERNNRRELLFSGLISAAILLFWTSVLRVLNTWKRSLLALNARLDTEVEQRTRELMQERERSVQGAKMVALGEMAGGIAHEINNPLATICLRAELLTSFGCDSPEATEKLNEHCGIILRTVERIRKIVLGLRAFARDATHDPFEKAVLATILESTLSLCQLRMKNHGMTLILPDPMPNFEIHCRPMQISQILINLLNNAYQAIEGKAEKWIRIECTQQERTVEIAVLDSGEGVPAELRDKIMQPFFTTKEIGKGAGLGLSISKGIAETHGGSLCLETRGGHTCFCLRLPLAEASMHAHKKVA